MVAWPSSAPLMAAWSIINLLYRASALGISSDVPPMAALVGSPGPPVCRQITHRISMLLFLLIRAMVTAFYMARPMCGKLRTWVTCGPPSPRRGLADLTVVDIMWTQSELLRQMSIQSMLPLAEHLPRVAKSSLLPTMGRYGLSTICRPAAPESTRFESIPPTPKSPTPWSISLAQGVMFSGLPVAGHCGRTSVAQEAAPFPICRSGLFRSTTPPRRARFISEQTMVFTPAPIWE